MKRIVISGTYCTGKTTLSLALSLATGIPSTHAPTMREILPELFPGKSLKQCSYPELLRLGMERFRERLNAESKLKTGFISDGCPIQEWLYGNTRLITGAYPDENKWTMLWKKIKNYRQFKDFELLLKGFEGMAKMYAKSNYDIFFHLPIEFPFVDDGHRPTSERFRKESEKKLVETYNNIDISPIIITGNLHSRIKNIINILSIEPRISIDEAIYLAAEIKEKDFDSVQLED